MSQILFVHLRVLNVMSFHILDIVWVWCEVSTCFTDPIHVTIHLLLQLLFFFQQQETSSTFYSVFFFCKLTEKLLLKLVHLNIQINLFKSPK